MAMHNLPELKPKFYGKYRGIVAIGEDPEGKGRIKVKVPALFGFKTLENWAYPVLPCKIDSFGITAVDPSTWKIPTGTGVWIEFEGGDPDKPIWVGFWK